MTGVEAELPSTLPLTKDPRRLGSHREEGVCAFGRFKRCRCLNEGFVKDRLMKAPKNPTEAWHLFTLPPTEAPIEYGSRAEVGCIRSACCEVELIS